MNATELVGGLFGGVIGVVLLVLFVIAAIMWFLFPIFVYLKMDRMLAEMSKANRTLGELQIEARRTALVEEVAAKERTEAAGWQARADALLENIEKNTRKG